MHAQLIFFVAFSKITLPSRIDIHQGKLTFWEFCTHNSDISGMLKNLVSLYFVMKQLHNELLYDSMQMQKSIVMF